jgi:hypothetical protein
VSGIVFFNAGDKISEVLPYTIPTGQDVHCIARWTLTAPKEDFFLVPTEVTIQSTGETLAVQFARDITFKFGTRGVIRIKPDYNAELEDPEKGVEHYPFARNEDEALVRGREIWNVYLRKIIEAHLNDCESARAAGGAPRSAQGFTKRALKLLNIQDPGEQYFRALQNGGAGETRQGDPAIAALQAQNQMMMSLFMQLLQGKQVDPSEVAKLASTPNAVGVSDKGEVLTSGIATGEIKKPISQENTYETLKSDPKKRTDRAAAAAKQFEG